MKIVVVKQAWAWLIVHGHKDIENRTWATRYRGPLLIQASKHKINAAKYAEQTDFARARGVTLPAREDLQVGGIIGIVNMVDCVKKDSSVWFEGPVGWKLTDAYSLPFIACKGKLGIYEAPAELMSKLSIPGRFLRMEQGRLL